MNVGGRPQRLLFASTGTKDPKASNVMYIEALAAPFTVNTMPEGTLLDAADHGNIGATTPADGGDCEAVLAQFKPAGVDIDALAAAPARRRRRVVRQVVERADGRPGVQERDLGQGGMSATGRRPIDSRDSGNPVSFGSKDTECSPARGTTASVAGCQIVDTRGGA